MNTHTSTFLIGILAIPIFVMLAHLIHNTPEGPFTFTNIFDTRWPLAFGVLLGTVLAKNEPNPRTVNAGTVVWLGIVVVDLVMWITRSSAVPHWSLILIVLVIGALPLLGWRAASSAVARRSLD